MQAHNTNPHSLHTHSLTLDKHTPHTHSDWERHKHTHSHQTHSFIFGETQAIGEPREGQPIAVTPTPPVYDCTVTHSDNELSPGCVQNSTMVWPHSTSGGKKIRGREKSQLSLLTSYSLIPCGSIILAPLIKMWSWDCKTVMKMMLFLAANRNFLMPSVYLFPWIHV